MDIHNRWGEKISSESSGLIGPDGQPLSAPSKDEAPPAEQSQEQEPQLDFFNYIASLGFQAMIFLGEMPNPITNQMDVNLKQAKFLIDTMIIIKDKTTGNLTKEESELLNGSIYELQIRFVEASKKHASNQ